DRLTAVRSAEAAFGDSETDITAPSSMTGSMLKREPSHTEDWEVEMAEENIDVELQDTGEFLASIHTRTGTEEIVLMFSDVEDVSQGALSNDETTARAAVEFLLSHQDAADLPDRIDLVDISAAYDGAVESIRDLRT